MQKANLQPTCSRKWRRTLLSLIVVLFSSPAASNANANAKTFNVKNKFRNAMIDFQKNQYRDAVEKFAVILRRHPYHTPSRIQLGLALYRLRKYQAASRVLLKIRSRDVPERIYFEYAYSAYIKRRWHLAAWFFSRMRPGAKFYRRATLYAGAANYNLGNFRLAKKYLLRPKTKISRLERFRRAMLSDIDLLIERSDAGEKVLPKIRKSPRPHGRRAAQTIDEKDPVLSEEEANKKADKELAEALLRAPSHGVELKSFYNVTEEETTTGTVSESRERATGAYAVTGLYAKIGKNSVHLGFDLDISISALEFEDPGEDNNVAMVGTEPWAELYTAGNYIGFSSRAAFNPSPKEDEQTLSEVSPALYMKNKGSEVSYDLSLKSKASNSGDGLDFKESTLSADLEFNFDSDTTLTTGAGSTFYQYSSSSDEGPGSSYAGYIKLKQLLPFSFTISGKVGITLLSSILKNIDESSVTADGTELETAASLEFTPLSWLQFDFGWTQVEKDWSSFSDEEFKTEWLVSEIRSSQTLSSSVKFSKYF